MCFAPQRRALFRHRNFQKWSDAEVFCTFWLGNVLRATTACNFSSLIWPDGYFSTLRSHTSLEQHRESRLFYLFAHLRLLSFDSFFWLFLWSSLIFSLLLFSSRLLSCPLLFSSLFFSDSYHLCSSICPYCRKFDFQTSFDYLYEYLWVNWMSNVDDLFLDIDIGSPRFFGARYWFHLSAQVAFALRELIVTSSLRWTWVAGMRWTWWISQWYPIYSLSLCRLTSQTCFFAEISCLGKFCWDIHGDRGFL